MYHFFFHSVYGHLGCFHVLAFVNSVQALYVEYSRTFLKIEVQLIHNVVLVSGVQQSGSVLYVRVCVCICTYIFDSFPM